MNSTRSSPSKPARLRAAAPLAAALFAAALVIPSCGRPSAASFEGKRALGWVQKQVAFGPRAPGTPGHDSCFAFLETTLRGYAPIVEADTFEYLVPSLGREVTLYNLLARFEPKATQRVILGAHWDTRLWADQDPDSHRRNEPILGANDGGSGVAVLLELARLLHDRRPALGVDIALFDGEDLGTAKDQDGWFRGAKRFVVRHAGEPPPIFVIVVDMVGRRDMTLHWEGNSYDQAGNIVDLVWGAAKKLNIRNFRSEVHYKVFDDHVPFQNAGIPAIVLIDFGFPEWHTHRDTLDIIDPASLEAVGRVLQTLVSDPTYLND